MNKTRLDLRHMNDIRDLVGVLNGYDVDGYPHEGVAWLGDGAVTVLTEHGAVGRLVHIEDDAWAFEPYEMPEDESER